MSTEFKHLRKIIIELSDGSFDAIKEMKSLSQITGMSVYANFKGRSIRITPHTKAYQVMELWKKLENNRISR